MTTAPRKGTRRPMRAIPRRTCPACARRYAGLIAPDCPICRGLGVLPLGAAALHHHEPAAIARAIDLYLEHAAQEATRTLPLADRRQALEAACDELRIAGVLHSTADASGKTARTPTPGDAQAATVTELEAHRTARDLGRPPSNRVLSGLTTPPDPTLEGARPRDGRPPQASAAGHRTALAVIADPLDPLGPDVAVLVSRRRTHDHNAAVLSAAVPEAIRQRRRPRRR